MIQCCLAGREDAADHLTGPVHESHVPFPRKRTTRAILNVMTRAFRSLTLAVWAFMFLSIGLATEGLTSGGAEIFITHDYARISMETPRKRPMPDHQAAYIREITEWETANRPVAEKALAAIESLLPRYRKKLPLLAKSFDLHALNDLSTEGTSGSRVNDNSAWLLTVDLDLYPGGRISSNAHFVFKTRPTKTAVRAFSRDVQAAALKSVGRTLPRSLSYTGYWLIADGVSPSLLLTTVPLATLQDALEKAPWRPMGYEAFRRAPALVFTTENKKHITRNRAGLLLANPSSAKFEPGNAAVSFLINGTLSPPMTLHRASRAEVVKLFDNAADPSLSPDDKKALEDGLEFISTLKRALAK